MDIFKKLTKGISFDPKTNGNGAVSTLKPAKNTDNIDKSKTSDMPKELDFFAEKKTVVSEGETCAKKQPKEPKTDIKMTGSTSNTCFKGAFESQEDLEEFRAKNAIRLALHQTSENSTSSASTSSLHHIVDLEDPEQIAPVRSFRELATFYNLDARLLERIEQVAKEEAGEMEQVAGRRAELLLPVNQSEMQTIVSVPTAVQMQATPVFLQGRDMIVMAPTGSGKTLAFILGIFGKLLLSNDNDNDKDDDGTSAHVRAVVISPTRELADQIHQQFMKFSPRDRSGKPLLRVGHLNKAVVNGWTAQRPASYPAILIATPLRLVHALRAKLLSIEHLKLLVLDEADRLLADGFDEQLDELLVAMKNPAKVQKALFSATMPSGVEATARTILTAPFRIVCGSTNPNGSTLHAINQKLIFCGNGNKVIKKRSTTAATNSNNDMAHDESVGKLMALRQLIHQGSLSPPVLIFVGSAVRAERLFSDLIQWSAAALGRPLPVDYLHAGRSQAERTSVLEAFRTGKVWFLITTDVLARGLDFPPLSAVINYDFPDSTASYIHRIGRTGRAGRSGAAYTLYTTDDLPELRIVVNVMRESGQEVSQWLQDHYTKSQGSSRLSKKLKHTNTASSIEKNEETKKKAKGTKSKST